MWPSEWIERRVCNLLFVPFHLFALSADDSTIFILQSIPLFCPLTLIQFIIIIIIVDKYKTRGDMKKMLSFQSMGKSIFEKATQHQKRKMRRTKKEKKKKKKTKSDNVQRLCARGGREMDAEIESPSCASASIVLSRIFFFYIVIYPLWDWTFLCRLLARDLTFVSAEILSFPAWVARLWIKCNTCSVCSLRTRKQNMSAFWWNEKFNHKESLMVMGYSIPLLHSELPPPSPLVQQMLQINNNNIQVCNASVSFDAHTHTVKSFPCAIL